MFDLSPGAKQEDCQLQTQVLEERKYAIANPSSRGKEGNFAIANQSSGRNEGNLKLQTHIL